MSVSSNLINAVAEHNIEDVRGGLWACIAVDPNFISKFKESFDYVLANGITESELFEKDDGETFSTEPTQENFSLLGGMLHSNFSKKKLDSLKEMGRILYPPKEKYVSEEEQDSSSDTEKGPQQREQTANPGATIGGAAIGAAAGAIIGKIAIGGAAAILGGLALGAAVGALLGTTISKRN